MKFSKFVNAFINKGCKTIEQMKQPNQWLFGNMDPGLETTYKDLKETGCAFLLVVGPDTADVTYQQQIYLLGIQSLGIKYGM
jgi:hypothetical protein